MTKSIDKMDDIEFARFFSQIREGILKDPIKNFIKHPKLINFKPTPAQNVALKCIFGQTLDAVTKHMVFQETLDEFGGFDLTEVFYTEVELYELMTGFVYEVDSVANAKNRINLIIGRRGGKCQDWDSPITLADGSRPTIGSLVDKTFEVLAYDEQTGKRIKAKARGIDNGVKGVYRIKTRTGFSLDRTANHPLMTQKGFRSYEDGLSVGDFLQIPRINDQFSNEKILDDEELLALVNAEIIPEVVFKSPKEQIILFLSKLFITYGENLDKNNFKYCTLSENLAKDVKHLLQRFGIITNLSSDSNISKVIYSITATKPISLEVNYSLEDYWFDEITSIEFLGERKTAGIEVETHHTYINDVVEHNTTLASIVGVYSAIKVNWKPYLTKTPVATVLVLSHSVDLSEEILDILKQLVEGSAILNRLRNLNKRNTTKIFHLSVPFIDDEGNLEYSNVRVKVGAASKKTTRGSAVCTLLCDEIAYWNLSEESADPDVEIIRAARMSLLQFKEHGTIIKMSSPGIKQGVLYDEWQKRDDLRRDYIQFKAPSWVWNTILGKNEFQAEHRLDSEGFDTELRANFVDSISNFISPEFVDMCVVKGVSFQPPADDNTTIYSAAIDAAFKGDRFAFCLVGYNEKRVTTYVLKYWEGSKKKPVQIHEVAQYIRTIIRQYGINEVAGDQYSFQPMRELFLQYGINLVENTFTLPYKRKIYFGLKRLIHNQQLDLPDIPLLSKEIKELVVEQTSSGQIRIGHPQGGSDDLSDALAVATYRVMEKAGVVQMTSGEVTMINDYGVRTDITGKAFTAPPIELLRNYAGFQGVIDNSHEWMQHPETGKWVRRSEYEETEIPTGDSGNFIF